MVLRQRVKSYLPNKLLSKQTPCAKLHHVHHVKVAIAILVKHFADQTATKRLGLDFFSLPTEPTGQATGRKVFLFAFLADRTINNGASIGSSFITCPADNPLARLTPSSTRGRRLPKM